MERRLTAILALDAVGYSRLMAVDEGGTHAMLKAHRDGVLVPQIDVHGGRLVKLTGDGALVEFVSVVRAVECAIKIQRIMADRNLGLASDGQIVFRIGVNLGDVIVEDGDIYGDGVNVASRLETISDPGGVAISSAVYAYLDQKLSSQFSDGGEQSLKNISRPVGVWRWMPSQSVVVAPTHWDGSGMHMREPARSGGAVFAHVDPIRSDMPSIAVLPFDNISNDAEQGYFADGIVDDIITGLSRVRQFFVIARNSTFTYKGKSVDIRQVGRELGVRYVLEGSVRKASDKVRITGQLIETGTGHHIWADRFDGELSDVFELQDLITNSVIGAIQPSIRAAEVSRSRRKRPDNLDVYDLYMQALPHVSALDRQSNALGLALLDQALERDPGYASALAMAAWCHAQRCVYSWTDDWASDSGKALDLAARAVHQAADDSFALSMLGAAHTLVRDFDRAEELLSRAVTIEPNCSWGWNRLGWLHGYRGKPQESISCFEKALRLSPLDPINFNCYVGIGAAYYLDARHHEAIRWMEKAIAANPSARWIYRSLVPAYVDAGRDENAANGLRFLLEDYPDMTCEKVRAAMLYSEPVMQRICTGLSRAGLPQHAHSVAAARQPEKD